jgi:uncharacterized protein (DUF58 family)
VKVYDPVDFDFPRVGLVELEDPESGDVILAGGVSKKFQNRYNRFFENHHIEWQHECRKRGVETLEIGTSEDPGAKLVQFFQRRKRR